MTRAEADVALSRYDDLVCDYRITLRLHGPGPQSERAFHRMNAERERVLDRLCGEEATTPLAGRAS